MVILAGKLQNIRRVGQNCIYTPYMTVYMVISLPKIPYIHLIYMVLANPKHTVIYGVFIRFWPTLQVRDASRSKYCKQGATRYMQMQPCM